MVRNRYFVCYDVSDPQRLVQTYKKMRGYGIHVQYSVFSCDLNDKEIIYMKEDLGKILNLNEDRVLVIDTGQAGRGNRVFTMGVPLDSSEDDVVVI